MESIRDAVERMREAAEKCRSQSMTSPDGRESKNTCGDTKRLEDAGIFKRFHGVTFESIEARGLPQNMSIRTNYTIAKEYAKNLEENVKNGIGLLMIGTYGTMKTTMAVAILRTWIDGGHRGIILPMCSLIDNLYTMRTLNKEEWARFEKRIRSTPLLILDDLGGENTDQSWILSKVDSIITERYNKMLSTIVTTNLGKSELVSTYSGRIIDRLRATSQVMNFTGGSQRASVSAR